MTEFLIASNGLLWVLVIVLALAVLALARQVGVLHERVAPAGALSPTSGPKPGEHLKAELVHDLEGREVFIGGMSTQATLILWISPSCPVCKALVPTARSLARDEKLRLVFASDGDGKERHRDLVNKMGIGDYPYILSEALGRRFEVSRLPFAALIAADGTLAGKGLVNSREHLESLLESMETGVATLQDYLQDAPLKVIGADAATVTDTVKHRERA